MTAVTTGRTIGPWVCPACRHPNSIDADVCGGCAVSFTALLRGSAGTRATPSTAPTTPGALDKIAAAAREIGIVVGLFVLWRLASAISVGGDAGAFARGRWIWRFERTLRLPSELSVQNGLLRHHDLVQAVNMFYLAAHVGGLVLFLPWLFIRHREHYRQWRNIIAVFTGVSVLIQLVSVAPPRLLPQYGFVDTGALYHESAYQHLGPGLIGQLSSMPSIHVGWAIAIAWAVISTSSSRLRWLVIAHPILTVYAVVATANHFWLDCIAAAGLVLVVHAVIALLGKSRRSRVEDLQDRVGEGAS
jgi:hypothetical protein